MNVVIDPNAFDELQHFLARTLAESLRDELQGAGIDLREKPELLESLLFSVTTILDGSRQMEHEGRQVLPILTFGDGRPPETLITAGTTSFMHEYAIGLAEVVLEGDGEEE